MKLLNVFLRSITLMAVASLAFEDPPACTLLLKVTEAGNGTGESYEWNCDDGTSIVPLQDSFPPDAFKSGVNTLHNGKMEDGQVVIEGRPDIRENDDSDTTVKTLGNKEVLVVRVSSNDSTVGFSAAVLKREIFGPASEDSFNLATGYDQCSYGALTFSPTEDSVAPSGVYEVGINFNTNGVTMSTVQTQITNQMISDLGSGWQNNFDYVMYCLPDGVTGGIAYAYINSWLSVYNDDWCTYPSGLMHEIGHNLGLAHSGEDTGAYNDQSGMMGFSYASDEGPVMCFNNPKNWQLKWYTDKVIEISGPWEGDLVGYADYGNIGANENVVVKISGDPEDYYLGFNRASGIASGTVEAANQVTMQRRSAGAGFDYAQSWLLAKMSSGQSYTVDNFAGGADLVVSVTSIDLTSVPAVAHVIITRNSFPTTSPTPCVNPIFNLELLTDDWGAETSWTLTDTNLNDVIAEGDGYLSSTSYEEEFCLSPGPCFDFTIFDSFGDGICCSYGQGSYTISVDGEEVGSGGEFGSSESVDFCIDVEPTPAPFQLTDVPTSAPTSPQCEDSTLLAPFENNQFTLALSCADIVSVGGCTNPDVMPLAQSHCPHSCNACDEYGCADSMATWSFLIGNFHCDDLVNLPPAQIIQFCGLYSDLAVTCRDTCEFCPI